MKTIRMAFACVLLVTVAGTFKVARADSLQTITSCCIGALTDTPSATVSFTSADNGLPSTINWSGIGRVNGPQDIGASMTASYTNFAPSSTGNLYNSFQQWATFTDSVTFNQSPDNIAFNFTISGTSSSANDYWQVFLFLGPCPGSLCGGAVVAGGSGNESFTIYDTANDGPGQYGLGIRLVAGVNLFNPNDRPAAGVNLSETADYNDTLTLDSVTLAPGETMIGQSGIDYSQLSAPTAPTPEPSSLLLLGTGLLGLVGAARRKWFA